MAELLLLAADLVRLHLLQQAGRAVGEVLGLVGERLGQRAELGDVVGQLSGQLLGRAGDGLAAEQVALHGVEAVPADVRVEVRGPHVDQVVERRQQEGADDGTNRERVHRVRAIDPSPHAGQQLHVAGSHAADGIGWQEQRQADDRPQKTPAQSLPAEGSRTIEPAAEDEGKCDPVGRLQLIAVDDRRQNEDDGYQPGGPVFGDGRAVGS